MPIFLAFLTLLAPAALGGPLPSPPFPDGGVHEPAPSHTGAAPLQIPPPGRTLPPVLLVPGWSDRDDDLEPLRERFLEAGWPEDRVLALEFEDPEGSNVDHAREVGAAVDSLLVATGAPEVDVVAHSMGGLAVRHYLLDREARDRVRRVAFLATPHRGTFAAYLAWGEGAGEMVPGSRFLNALNVKSPVPEGVEVLTVRTPVDMRIIPTSSATLPAAGVSNLELCCPSHTGLLEHEETFIRVRSFLQQPERGGAGP